MTATNHALTGALIGFVIGEPLIALPAAFASHYVCDVLPHFDFNLDVPNDVKLRTKAFRYYLIMGAVSCVILVACLAALHPLNWFLAAACAFVATSPDLIHLRRYINARQRKPWKHHAFFKYTIDYQKFANPLGAAVEIAWFIAAVILILPFLR